MINFYPLVSHHQYLHALKKYRFIYSILMLILIGLHVIIIIIFTRGEVVLPIFLSSVLDILIIGSIFFHIHTRYLPLKYRLKLLTKFSLKQPSRVNGVVSSIQANPITFLGLTCTQLSIVDTQGIVRVLYIEQSFAHMFLMDDVVDVFVVDALIIGQEGEEG